MGKVLFGVVIWIYSTMGFGVPCLIYIADANVTRLRVALLCLNANYGIGG